MEIDKNIFRFEIPKNSSKNETIGAISTPDKTFQDKRRPFYINHKSETLSNKFIQHLPIQHPYRWKIKFQKWSN